ncbi:hypothetical protein, partial [Escherichia coli]|uniref:hypothetical protein n=1 Tax=Escherichia coli TaxID=562 RepID=UPI001BC8A517
ADRNRSHWSTSKTPSYTKSVSWQHHPVCQQAFHLFFRLYFVVIGDTSLKKAPVVVSQPCGV